MKKFRIFSKKKKDYFDEKTKYVFIPKNQEVFELQMILISLDIDFNNDMSRNFYLKRLKNKINEMTNEK